MDFIPKDKILELSPETVDTIRKEINFGKPGEMKEAVNILREWIQQQPHIKKKDFTDLFIETTIVSTKGSLELAKKQIDTACTMRTLLPHFFGVTDLKKDFENIYNVGSAVVMPKVTKENHRIFILKVHGQVANSTQFLNFYRFGICIAEYMKAHDYIGSYQCIMDIRSANISDLVTNMNPMELRQALTLVVDCYGLRIKGIHIVTTSKLVDTFIAVLKSLLKPKMIQRLEHHSNCDSLVKLIGKEYLPEDLGGTQPSIKQIRESWSEVFYSSEFREYLCEMNKACTDESCRPRDKFNDEYAGMPGTFRILSVD